MSEDIKKQPELTDQDKIDLKDNQDCKIEIDGILKKYNCAIVPVTIIQGGQITSMVNIIKAPKVEEKKVSVPE